MVSFADIRDGIGPRGKTFHSAPIPGLSTELSDDTSERGRYYTTPEGNVYPSVTTVLGRALDKSSLLQWKARVGEEEAKRVGNQAKTRGTAIHTLAERYLNNERDYLRGPLSSNKAVFGPMREVLDQHVDNIIGCEIPLYNDAHRTAGRIDLAAEYDGSPSVIDFKTSKRIKDKGHILSYFLQVGEYCNMLAARLIELGHQEMVAKLRGVLIIGVDGERAAQVFAMGHRETMAYSRKAAEIFSSRPAE